MRLKESEMKLVMPVVCECGFTTMDAKHANEHLIMPRINPHATVLQQDAQLINQIKWLKAHHFKTARDAQEAGH